MVAPRIWLSLILVQLRSSLAKVKYALVAIDLQNELELHQVMFSAVVMYSSIRFLVLEFIPTVKFISYSFADLK
jgi:hypothetical protein